MKKAALVVANSEYMARRARKVFGIEPVVIYPQIDVQALSAIEMPPLEERPYVLMVGHEEVKGVSIFREIARAMPDHEFMLVGRTTEGERREGNVTLRGFSEDPVEHYREAGLVLMPSVWEEGFGMVSVEAAALGIPSIVSARGGLPETVPLKECVVRDFRRPDAWVERIEHVLANYDAFSLAASAHAEKLDMRKQFGELRQEIERVLA
jgi:glycosyltransferase involved in cell wall biosynthesis